MVWLKSGKKLVIKWLTSKSNSQVNKQTYKQLPIITQLFFNENSSHIFSEKMLTAATATKSY